MRDFDDNEFPLGYLITFRCYGTWLHGDPRGSMDRKHNVHGTPKITPNTNLEQSDSRQTKHVPIVLDARQRKAVEGAARTRGAKEVTALGVTALGRRINEFYF